MNNTNRIGVRFRSLNASPSRAVRLSAEALDPARSQVLRITYREDMRVPWYCQGCGLGVHCEHVAAVRRLLPADVLARMLDGVPVGGRR